MKLEFDRTANGGYVIDLKANSDFNLHLERMSNEEDVYIYVRGSSEGEYKFYKKVFGKVVDMDFDIPDAIVPKYYRIKTSVAPTLCEVTGDVENVTGQEVKPGGGDCNLGNMIHIYHEEVSPSDDKQILDVFLDLDTYQYTDNSKIITLSEDGESNSYEYSEEMITGGIDISVSDEGCGFSVLRDTFDSGMDYSVSVLVSEDGWKCKMELTGEERVIDIAPNALQHIFIPTIHKSAYVEIYNSSLNKTISFEY